MARYWVSVTGLELKNAFCYPQFMFYTIPSFTAAQAQAGNVLAKNQKVGDIHHTLTVWEDRSDMVGFLRTKEHVQAMKISKTIGGYGKVYGYPSDTVPSWKEALKQWEENGRVVLGDPRPGDKVGSHAHFASSSGKVSSKTKSVNA